MSNRPGTESCIGVRERDRLLAMNRYFGAVERVLLAACLLLLVFFYVYVYGFGKIRGPIAREQFYELGELNEADIAAEKARIMGSEELKPEVPPADNPE
jgi:hypothetical protein